MANSSEPLWQWLRSPSRWTRPQQLAMAALACLALSLLGSRLDPGLGDWFVYIALALIGAVLALVAWRHFRSGTEPEQDAETDVSATDRSVWFWPCLALVVAGCGWLYLTRMFIVEDPNPEAMECPLAVTLLEKARAAHRPADAFWLEDPLVAHWKEQDPVYTKAPLGRFKMQWAGQAAVTLNLTYLPFVKWMGINRKLIVCYSTCFAVITWLGTGLLGWWMFGRWCGLVAAALMATALGWLIHVRVGYAQVAPSAALMVLLALCLYGYWRSHRWWLLGLGGCVLGMMYLVGWIVIVFGVLLAGSVLLVGGSRRPVTLLLHGIGMLTGAVAVAVAVAWLYAWRYDFPSLEIHETIRELTFGRYKDGEPGLLKLSISGKMAYATKCLFWDSRTNDGHVDKYLEGYPAIPWMFTVCLALGLVCAVKERDSGDQLLLWWALAVFGVIGLLFIYSHRYALIGLPALSIIAARGILAAGGGWRKPFSLIYAIGIGALWLATVWGTYNAYYGQYLQRKEANFEMDRLRGHHGFVEWLNRTGKPEETLVVMGDTIMFPPTSYVFNTYGQPYHWVYWSNYFRTGSTPEQVRGWEQQLPPRFRRIVYAFSPTLLGDPQRGLYINDPRPFLAAHPDLRPCWTYSYAGRPPLILAFEVRR